MCHYTLYTHTNAPAHVLVHVQHADVFACKYLKKCTQADTETWKQASVKL